MPQFTAQQLETVLDSVSDAVFTVDRDLNIITFNRSAEHLSGYARHEVIGRRCSQVFRCPPCGDQCPLTQALKSGRVFHGETTIRNRDEDERRVALCASVLRDEGGEVVGGVEVFYSGSFKPCDGAVGEQRATVRSLSLLDASERTAIEDVLRHHHWNQSAAAQELGISRTTLWRKMNKLGIRSPRRRDGRPPTSEA